MDWRKAVVLVAVGVVGTAHAAAPPLVVIKKEATESSAVGRSADATAGTPFEFMGITLGAPLGPECPREQIPYAGAVYNLGAAKSACWVAMGMQPGARTDTVNNDLLTLVPLSNKRPTGTGSVTAVVVNGVVEGLTISTDGFVHAQELFEQLKQKLGAPTKHDTVQVVSGVGANFAGPRAVWELPGTYVQFNGIVGAVNTGVIQVFTNTGKAREAARQQQRAKSF
ncbi:hypothetical protein JAK62_19525 [Stenotrophomonas maltophilia]|uniref:hypothetical protein n=1 Tax=Stenotrophomonas maltophilia TaxID=40324 RepID=UPI0015E01C37|nr:hypothetical protein [Stenotrophomonas maltophilia]MBA0348378.1 hypothetical protein [Stenotrophomonas maltophilia]MCU1193519.1 hypothetical protein [Stenotrophomonas maltophilia]